MKCVNHPDRDATAKCLICKDLLCAECKIEYDIDKFICKSCAEKLNSHNDNQTQSQNSQQTTKDVFLFNIPTESKQPEQNGKKSSNGCGCALFVLAALCILLLPTISGILKSGESTGPYKASATTARTTDNEHNDAKTLTKYPVSKDDLPNYNISSFENISSRDRKRMRFKITLSDRTISQEDVINIGKFFYNTLIVDLNKDYGYIDGFQILIYGEFDSQSWGATVGSISYNIDGSNKFQNASVIKSWDGVPSERAFRIVGALMNALAESDEEETIINQQIANKYNISVEELKELYLDTSYFRIPKYFDVK